MQLTADKLISSTLTVRNKTFDFSAAGTYWLNDDPYATHMFNATSLLLPDMEGFVIYTVKKCRELLANETLIQDCECFIRQEVNHSREHVKYNQVLRQDHFHADAVQIKLRKKIQFIKKRWSLLSQLAVGVAFENMTSHISKVVMKDSVLSQAHVQIDEFWSWHLLEEIEHQHVLMAIYRELGGGYIRRISIHALVMFYYSLYALLVYLSFLSTSKVSRLKGLFYAFTKNTFFVKGLINSLCFYKVK